MKDTFNALPFPKDREIEWLLNQGISDDALTLPWPIRGSAVRFERGGVFDFDAEGDRAIIFHAEGRGECADLIAWSAKSGRIGSWRNAAFCLGDLDDCFNPGSWALGGGLYLHENPLAWLKANRDGITIIRPDLTYAMLRHVPRIVFADAAYGRQVRQWLVPPKPSVEFLVAVQEERRAA